MTEIKPTVTNKSGIKLKWNAMLDAMYNEDEEICDFIDFKIAPETPQEFFTAFEKEYENKYHKEWYFSGTNIQY